MHRITLIPGDGIGPEVTGAAVRVIEAVGVKIEWETMSAGAEVMTKHGTVVPDEVINSISRNGVALKGPITTPIGSGFSSANVMLRKKLNLYANVRPRIPPPRAKTPFHNLYLWLTRENQQYPYS